MTVSTRQLPADITSYDLVKCAAVFFMIVDHIGAYFYPDMLWWRAVGRIDCAFWFFLIGYANTRELPTRMWAGAVVLLAVSFVTGTTLLPFNILVTMLLLRIIIDPVMNFALKSRVCFWLTAILLALFLLPTFMIFEYGTGAVLMTMFGYLVRRRRELRKDVLTVSLAAFTVCVYAVTEKLIYDFSVFQFFFVLLGTAGVMATLFYFRPEAYPEATRKLPKPLVWLTQFGGRYTLEIYIVHVVIFKIASTALGIDGHRFFNFQLI